MCLRIGQCLYSYLGINDERSGFGLEYPNMCKGVGGPVWYQDGVRCLRFSCLILVGC